MRPFATTIGQNNKGEKMNDITRQILILLFFVLMTAWKLAEITTWIILKLCSWNLGATFLIAFMLIVFCLKYNKYKEKGGS